MARPPITRASPYTFTRGQFAGRTFTSERQYRDALAQVKGFPSWDVERRAASKAVRSREAYERLRPSEKHAHARSLNAVSLMRTSGMTIKQAARQVGTTVETILKFGGSSLTRGPRNRYVAKPSDRLFRPMQVVTSQGPATIEIRDSRSAAKVSRHHNAVRRYLTTGDASQLREFRRVVVRSNKQGYRLASDFDFDMLNQLGRAGELSFEHIYRLAA